MSESGEWGGDLLELSLMLHIHHFSFITFILCKLVLFDLTSGPQRFLSSKLRLSS